MLRFIQTLQPSLNRQQLSREIYNEFFAKLAKQPPVLSPAPTPFPKDDELQAIAPTSEDVWIFGYGSLMWKADFPYIDRRRGYVWGFKRRFYQHSIDHRGVPAQPGRVVTLMPGNPSQDRVYGMAYRIAASQKRQVLDHLDYREKNGYERCSLDFHEYNNESQQPIQVIMYVATQANDSYAGDVWQVPCIAKQIFTSAGPSGSNREYLFNLALSMAELFPSAVDEHLTELVQCVQQLIERDEPQMLDRALGHEIMNVLEEEEHDQVALALRLEALKQRCERPGWREWLLSQELQRQGS